MTAEWGDDIVFSKNPDLIIMDKLEQGTAQWLAERVGNITMSKAKALITGGKGKTRATYISEVASEIIIGASDYNYNSHDMIRGNVLEPYALQAYEAVTGNKATTVGLGYLDSKKIVSASPDALIYKDGVLERGVEIKCLKPKNHIEFMVDFANPEPNEFMAQIQGNMWIFGTDYWDFCSYCPEFDGASISIISVKRDEEMIKKIMLATLSAVLEVDEIVSCVRETNHKNIADINKSALEAVSIILDYGTGGIE